MRHDVDTSIQPGSYPEHVARKPRSRLVDRSEYYEITGRLQHYACFHCRKTFKQGFPRAGEATLCPQCRQPMTNMGTDFKAPAQREHRQWQKVQQLAQAGVRFFPVSGRGTPGERPATLAEVPAFLRRVKPPSAGQRDLERPSSTTSPAPREGRVITQGQAPHQQFWFLGRLLTPGMTLEVWHQGAWRRGTLARGQGNIIRTALGPVPLTPTTRLRWPTT